MHKIMTLVNSTSKQVEVYRELLNASGHIVFLQLIHNTDSDSLFFLMIKNFHTFEIEEINFDAGVNINSLS